MKNILLFLSFLFASTSSAQVAINTDGSNPHASAMLDIESSTKGILIPRMTSIDRLNINTPETGLLVFDTDLENFCYYLALTTTWIEIPFSNSDNVLIDQDLDTKIAVEENPDEDIIRFKVKGSEVARMDGNNFHFISPGASLFIGYDAGMNDDGQLRENTFIGYEAGKENVAGARNSALGLKALISNNVGNNNSAFGYYSLFSNTEGDYNSAFGSNSLDSNDDGDYNSAFGYNSLSGNTSGSDNVAIGKSACQWNQSGSSNVAIGASSLLFNTQKSNLVAVGDHALWTNGNGATLSYHATKNTAVGSSALKSNSTGYNNTAVGSSALKSNSTGYNNTAHGLDALTKNTIGHDNTVLGSESLFNNISGNFNTACGVEALYTNSGGHDNTAIGTRSLQSNTYGDFNTAGGFEALKSNTHGLRNTAVGHSSLKSNTIGNNNTSVGIFSLESNFQGLNNTALGYSANSINVNFNNSMGLGYDADPSGHNTVHIGNNSVSWIGGQVAWSTYSDGRFKTNISENVGGLDFINRLRPVIYNFDLDKIHDWKLRNYGERDEYDYEGKYQIESYLFSGFIAQEVVHAANDSGYDFSGVSTPKDEKGFYSLRYGEFVVPLVKAVQELTLENENLRSNFQQQEDEIASLKSDLEEIRNLVLNKQ